jgi:hypothetical protein
MCCHSIFVVRGVKPSEVHRRMLAQQGENCNMQKKVYQWVERFSSGRTGIFDEECLSHPNAS